MRGIKTKQDGKWKRVVVFYFFVFVLIMLLNSLLNVYEKKKAAEEALVKMQAEKEELAERKDFLDGSINKLSTPEGREFEVRRKFNVAEVGESVAIIVEEELPEKDAQNTQTKWQTFKNFWSGLFD